MNEHNFGYQEYTEEISGLKYKRCVRCGAVMFIDGDNFFNLHCPKGINQTMEQARARIQSNTGANL